MTWEEHKKKTTPLEYIGLKKTDIECPNCGKKIYKRTDIVLASYPPTYRYECKSCDWYGFAKT